MGLHLSVLRVLAFNRSVCADAPVLELEEKTNSFQKLFSSDGSLAALPRKAATFLQTRGTITWPPTTTPRYLPPKVGPITTPHN